MRLRGERAYTCRDISEHLRSRGWIVPAYTLPPDVDDVSVLGVVIREGFSRDMADNLLADLGATIDRLEANPPATPTVKPHHRRRHRVC